MKKPICLAVLALVTVCHTGCDRPKSPLAAPPLTGASPDRVEAEAEAIAAAQAWLEWVDAGDFAKTWDAAASFFKEAVTQAEWVKTAQTFRPPLGKMVSRKLKTTQYATSLPGAPDGHYVVIQFDTVFERKQSAVETVTPMLDTNGQWRVSGYFIK